MKDNKQCEYCDNSKTLLSINVIDDSIWGWREDERKVNFKETREWIEEEMVYIDRGYLRLSNNDSDCIDHGARIKINYCPICGGKLTFKHNNK